MRFARGRTDSAEEIDPFILRLTKRPWTASAFAPDARQRALLAEARLILEPQLDRLSPMGGAGGFEGFGQRFF